MTDAASALIDWRSFWSAESYAEDWLLEPLFPRGRSIAIFAGAKRGKSLLVLDLLARLATGQRCFDRPPGEPVSVVYIDLEMTEDDLRDRLVDMGYGAHVDLEHLHYYLLPSLPPLDSASGGEAVLNIARRHAAQVIVIDTTSRVLQGGENDADTIRNFYMCTGLPLKAHGVTVIRLDHEGKDSSKGQRGTSAKADDVDLVWQLLPTDEGVRLKATHRRQGWIPEVVDLVRLEEPLRHERAAQSWPSGTMELARALDDLEVPHDWGAPRAAAALRDAGHKARNDVIRAAVRYRRNALENSGPPSGPPSFYTLGPSGGATPSDRFGATLGATSGHPPADNGASWVSLIGDTPGPSPCPGGCGYLLFPAEPCPDGCEQAVAQ